MKTDLDFRVNAAVDTNTNTETETETETETDTHADIDTSSKGRAWVLRLKPDEDLVGGLLEFAAEQGAAQLQMIGAVGSLMQATLLSADGRQVRVEGPGIEIIGLSGQIDTRQPEGAQATGLRMVVADTQGQVHSGQPAPGGNPICVTIELFVQDCG